MNRPSMPGRLRPSTLTLAFVLLVAALASAMPAAAQDWRLEGLGGQQLREGDARGNLVVVVWASWSPRSRGIAERVNALDSRWGKKARVVTVNFQEDRPAVESFLAGGRFNAPVFLDSDGAFSKRYSIANLPGLLVLKGGEVAYRGKLPDDADAILAGAFP
jgi:thiol-disulfide isomerase/thioredoxin